MPRLCGSRLDLCAFLRPARTYEVYIGHLSTEVGLCTANDLPFLPPVYTHLVSKFLFGGGGERGGNGEDWMPLCDAFFPFKHLVSASTCAHADRQTDRQTDNMTPTHTQRNNLIKRVIPVSLNNLTSVQRSLECCSRTFQDFVG